MRQPVLGAKYQTTMIQVKNAESSAVIPNGTPVVFAFNGTDDGLAVVLPASASASKAVQLFAGVVSNPGQASLPVGSIGDAIAYGLVTNALLLYATRSATASTTPWVSVPAFTMGEALGMDTVNNGFAHTVVSTAGVVQTGAATSDTVAAGYAQALAVLAQTFASTTTQAASNAGAYSASTAWMKAVKVFLRAM